MSGGTLFGSAPGIRGAFRPGSEGLDSLGVPSGASTPLEPDVSPIARSLAALLLLLALTPPAQARTLRVGPERMYRTVHDAAVMAQDGDVILLDAGTYTADIATWTQNDLVLWAPEGRARLVGADAARDARAIWTIQGRNFTAENVEFTGARGKGRGKEKSAAGVRIHARGKVTLRRCSFHDNENGVVGSADEIVIERCVFDHNGAGDGKSHGIDVAGPRVTVQGSYLHRAVGGHNLRARGETNFILANRIMDEADGTGSNGIDVPDCGRTYLIGNIVQQGPESRSYPMVAYGSESDKNAPELYAVNNTFVNDGREDGFFMKLRRGTRGRFVNNIFYGPGTPWVGGDVEERRNAVIPARDNEPRFSNPSTYDFRLTPDSPHSVVDRGASPGSSEGFDLTPKWEYSYDADMVERPTVGSLDLGAFEDRFPRIEPAAAPPAPEHVVKTTVKNPKPAAGTKSSARGKRTRPKERTAAKKAKTYPATE